MARLNCFYAAAVLAMIPFAGYAETLSFKATLTSSAEVPPSIETGSGQAAFAYDTVSKELRYTVSFEDLSSRVRGSHIHGPAGPSENAGIVKTFTVPDPPIEGQMRLTDTLEAVLLAGQLYIDVHTDKHPEGEIRGQIEK